MDKETEYRQKRLEDMMAASARIEEILKRHNDDPTFSSEAYTKRTLGKDLSLADVHKLLDQQLLHNAYDEHSDAYYDRHDEYRKRVRKEREEDKRKSEEAVDRERNRMERWKKASGGKISDLKKSEKKSSGGKD